MKFFFMCLLFFSHKASGNDGIITEKHLIEAKQKIKQIGINSDQLKKEDLSFWGSCSEALSDSPETDKIVFSLKLKESVNLYGQSMRPGSEIQVCNGKVTFLKHAWSEKPDEMNLRIGKYVCFSMADFSEIGELCRCPLRAQAQIMGVNLLAGSELHLFKGKPYGVFIDKESSSKKYPAGFYKLEKGILTKQKDWEILNTCGDEVRTR